MSSKPLVPVRVYSTHTCAYCALAKRLLGARGIPFEEIDVTNDHGKRVWLVEATGRRTVPQIFIRDEPIGGYHELALLDRSGRLKIMLGESNEASVRNAP